MACHSHIDGEIKAAESRCALLSALGHHCESYFDGACGIAAVEAATPGLVFVDIGMPELDGHAVARRLGQSPSTRHIPLFALTGYDGADARRRSRASVFDRHLVKPVSLDELQAAIDAALAPPRR